MKRIISNNLLLLRYAWKGSPAYVIRSITGDAQHRVIVFFEHVYMTGYIINAIVEQRPFIEVAAFVACIFAIVVVTCNIVNPFFDAKINPNARVKILQLLRKDLYDKAARLDLKCYDDPNYYTDFVWAMSEAGTRVDKVLETISGLIGSVIGIGVVGGYIFLNDKIGLIAVAISFVGVFGFSLLRNKVQINLDQRMRPHQRKRDYTTRVLYLADYAKEIRLNDMRKRLYSDFDDAVKRLKDETNKGTRAIALIDFTMNFVLNDLVFTGGYLLYLLYSSIVKKLIPYGTMVTLFNSVRQLRWALFGLAQVIPRFQENSLYIEKIRTFLDYDIQVKSAPNAVPAPKQGTLQLKDVSFAYGDKNVINNVNLSVKHGEKIALVGYNGAGKTTLVKLLMRLYDPSSGSISLDGADVRTIDLDSYRGVFQTVFQDYQLFAATVAQNITMDELQPNEAKLQSSLEKSGFAKKLSQLTKGLDTQVTREFDEDGALFSGGEAQSLAIARALYKDSSILILDEPSSALDPLAEYNLNKTMLSLTDKTVIIISHRLSTTKMVDKIYMFEQGSIIESGSHDELIALGGKYAEMYNLQAGKYC